MIPTAEEFLKLPFNGINVEPTILETKILSQKLIDFAKLQVEEALANRDRLYETYYADEITFTESNKEFIKNSYPLTNIK
jgi:hypothetical protein